MNIINESCLGGFIYNNLNIRQINPFRFTMVNEKDFMYLVLNYDKINFYNYKFIEIKDLEDFKQLNFNSWVNTVVKGLFNRKNKYKMYYVLIDNKVKLYFRHYFISDKPINNKRSTNKYFTNISDLETIYLQRVNLMLASKENPIFIYEYNYHNKSDDELIQYTLKHSKYKLIILGKKKSDLVNYQINTLPVKPLSVELTNNENFIKYLEL